MEMRKLSKMDIQTLLDLITITRQHAKKVMEQKLTIQLLINKQQEGQRDYIVHTEMNI